MVEALSGHGKHFRDVLAMLGRNNPNFSNLVFRETDKEDIDTLRGLIQVVVADPSLNPVTKLIVNLINTEEQKVIVLSGPHGLSRPDKYKPQELPDERESYVVDVESRWHKDKKREVLILVGNPRSAVRIAARGLVGKGWEKREIIANARLVSPQEFVEKIQEKKERGEVVPNRLRRFLPQDQDLR